MRRWMLPVLLLTILLLPARVQAQEPVAYGLFFYSPACGHCHDVINNDWGAIQDEFGEQLQVLFVNIQIPEGSRLMSQITSEMNINSSGVPMLVLGETVLIGSIEIPARTADVIRTGLVNGGIDVPPVAGVEAVFMQALGDAYQTNVDLISSSTQPALLSDVANGFAIAILIAMVTSISAIGIAFINPQVKQAITGRWQIFVVAFTALITVGFIGSLLFGSDEIIVTGITGVMAVLMTVVAFVALTQRQAPTPRALVPVVLVVGLIVASYMTYVETTAADAVCGVVGNCNIVQQSEYASLFGIPIGVIGIIGYVSLFAVWLVSLRDERAHNIFFLLVAGGMLFTIYLTFLEPFVIGASCMWCLTSALTMLLLLWMSAPTILSNAPQLIAETERVQARSR
jgi:hypothetical protein